MKSLPPDCNRNSIGLKPAGRFDDVGLTGAPADNDLDIENNPGPIEKEKRKVYPFSMRKIKEQAKKNCTKNGGDFKLGMVLHVVIFIMVSGLEEGNRASPNSPNRSS